MCSLWITRVPAIIKTAQDSAELASSKSITSRHGACNGGGFMAYYCLFSLSR